MVMNFNDWVIEVGEDSTSQSAQIKYGKYLERQNKTIDKLQEDGELGEPIHD